ncbi:MAG: hypothetical protein WCQ63_00335 [Methanomethylophilus sp.]|nr:hypothetical protein [Methanomethylophilus sp.]MDD4222348.1 hypothetical protein [Methanomethylophilus sp.]MDD4669211.1 hypothetical protein [Methanomethylophilus sp.]
MWNVLGEEAIFIDIPYTFKSGMDRLAQKDEKGKKFREFLKDTDVQFLINGKTEENCFMLRVPDSLTPEDIQLMADVILEVAKSQGEKFIMADQTPQHFKVIISNSKEPELLGIHKTPGMSSMEVFKPIIQGWDAPGRQNTNTLKDDDY